MDDLQSRARRLAGAALVLIAVLGLVGYGQDFQRMTPPLPFGAVDLDGNDFYLKDFIVHHGIARAAWTGGLEQPYLLAEQEAYWRDSYPALPLAKPTAYAPTWHLVAGPALLFPLEVGFGVWLLLSFAALAWLWWQVLLPSLRSKTQLWLLLAATFSLDVLLGLKEGQTTFLTTAAMGGLWFYGREERGRLSSGHHLLLALLFVVTTIKPGLGLVALALLLGQRRWLASLLGGALSLLIALGLTPVLGGLTWIPDYLDLLRHYRWELLSDYFKPSMEPTTGTSLAVLLNAIDIFSPPTVFTWLSYLSLCLFVLSVLGRWLGWYDAKHLVGILAFCYLLFAPHLTCTEDFLLLVAIASGGFWAERRFFFWKLLLLFIVMNLGPEAFWPESNLLAAAAKVILALCYLGSLRPTRQTEC